MGIFFSILSPAIYSINNYIDKFLLDKHSLSPTVITVYSGFFALLAGIGILIFTGFYHTDSKSTLIILASGFLTSMYLLPYFKALTTDETSYVVPLFQLIPVFVLILSFILLGETLSGKQYIGSFIIILAGFFLSIEKAEAAIFRLRPAFWYMVLSSFLSALAIVLFKFGVKEIPFWHTLPYESFGITLGALAILLYGKNRSRFMKETKKLPKRVFLYMSLNESIYLFARYTSFFAVSLISVSLVSVLSGFQPLFVFLYGIILSLWFPKILTEVISKKNVSIKIVAIIGIFLGLLLIFS